MTEPDRTYRATPNLLWGAGSLVPAAVVTVLVVVNPDARTGLASMPVAPFVVVLLAVSGFVAFLRPKVVIGASTVLVVNPFFRYAVPYQDIRRTQIGSVYVVLALRSNQIVNCFAVASGRRGRLYHETLARRMLDDVNRRREQQLGEPAGGGQGDVRRRLDWPSVLVVILGVAVLVLSLV